MKNLKTKWFCRCWNCWVSACIQSGFQTMDILHSPYSTLHRISFIIIVFITCVHSSRRILMYTTLFKMIELAEHQSDKNLSQWVKKKSFVFSTVQMKCDCFTNPKSDPKSNPQKFPISKTESWRCTGGGRHLGCVELQVEQSYRPGGCGRSSSKTATESVSWKPLSVLEALQLIRRAAHPQFHSLHSWSYSRSFHCWRARWSLSSVQDEAWRKVEWLTSIIIGLVVLISRTRPLLSAPPVQKVKVLLRLPLSVWSEHESNPSHPARFPPSSAPLQTSGSLRLSVSAADAPLWGESENWTESVVTGDSVHSECHTGAQGHKWNLHFAPAM